MLAFSKPKGLLGMFKKKKNRQSDEMALQITSMADIFMILIVFLLKSFATGTVSLVPTAGLKLPAATAEAPDLNALKVEISETSVQIEGKPVMELHHFATDAKDISANGSSTSLATAFETERKRQLMIAQGNSAVQVDSKLIVVADRRVPYATVKTVLASAALHGFTEFKLAVIKKGE